jgi:peptidoglycan hydrolase-like protein with peptidoglycan-binding domain
VTLREIASGAPAVALALIGGDRTLATQTQERLAVHGILDPPPDGSFGPVSLWAIAQFLRKVGLAGQTTLDRAAVTALLANESAFPLRVPDSLAGRIVRAMQAAGHWLARHPDCVNIVYVEGMDADGRPNTDAPNVFNDLRLMLRVSRAGHPSIEEIWEATTEPGKHYTLIEKLDPRGAAASPSGNTRRGRSAPTWRGGPVRTRRSCRPRRFACSATSTRTSNEPAINGSTGCSA